MKFILWTLVWFGICIIGEYLLVDQMGSWSVYISEYSQSTRQIASLLEFILWFVLYFGIVRREK